MDHQIALHSELSTLKVDVQKLQDNFKEMKDWKNEIDQWRNETNFKVLSIEEENLEQKEALNNFSKLVSDTNKRLDQVLVSNYKGLITKAIIILFIILILYYSLFARV